MFRSRMAASIAVMALACVSWPAPARAADPLVLFLLRMVRDQVLSSAIESGATSSARPRAPASFAAPAPPSSEAERLKRLIDESFAHLGAQQRQDLHASLLKILDDPKNAAERGAILAEFTAQAGAAREAHRQLSRLSEDDMRRAATEARVEYAKLPPDQRQQLLLALEHGVPGMPRALHELMLAEFRSVPAAR